MLMEQASTEALEGHGRSKAKGGMALVYKRLKQLTEDTGNTYSVYQFGPCYLTLPPPLLFQLRTVSLHQVPYN